MAFEGKDERTRNVRVEDVAREAGVSPITVSRTLSNPDLVKPETRERVLQAVEKTGYIVNTFASSLRSGRSSLIAMFVSNIENQHVARATRGCADALENSGFHLMMAHTNYSARLEADFVGSVLPLRPAALVFTGIVQAETTRSMIRSRGMAVMEMWDHVDDPMDMLVGFSNVEGGRLMGEHLGASGFRNVAYVGRTNTAGNERLAGFREGLAAAGTEIGFLAPMDGHEPVLTDGAQALRTVMKRFPQCDAIFFSSEILAVGASLEASRLGLIDRIAIAGYGDSPIAEALPVPLTTVHVSSYEMGFRAGKMLLKHLSGETVREKVVILPNELRIRRSTARRPQN